MQIILTNVNNYDKVKVRNINILKFHHTNTELNALTQHIHCKYMFTNGTVVNNTIQNKTQETDFLRHQTMPRQKHAHGYKHATHYVGN